MTFDHLLAVVAVRDLQASREWYSALLSTLTDPDGNMIRLIGGFRVQY